MMLRTAVHDTGKQVRCNNMLPCNDQLTATDWQLVQAHAAPLRCRPERLPYRGQRGCLDRNVRGRCTAARSQVLGDRRVVDER